MLAWAKVQIKQEYHIFKWISNQTNIDGRKKSTVIQVHYQYLVTKLPTKMYRSENFPYKQTSVLHLINNHATKILCKCISTSNNNAKKADDDIEFQMNLINLLYSKTKTRGNHFNQLALLSNWDNCRNE